MRLLLAFLVLLLVVWLFLTGYHGIHGGKK